MSCYDLLILRDVLSLSESSNDETAESVLTKHVKKVIVGQPTDVDV